MGNFSDSPLVAHTRLSPHRNSPRGKPIAKITVHHTAGNIGLEALGDWLARPSTRASYNYGISSDGRVGLFVGEGDRCWGSSSRWNDHQAVVIGVANDRGAPEWTVSGAAFGSLVELMACICRRNPGIKQPGGMPGLHYDGTRYGSLTRHNMFSAQACPGPYLQQRFPEMARRVNTKLLGATLKQPPTFPVDPENIDRMVGLGVINTPGFWEGVDHIQWLDELMANAGRYGRLDRRVENGIADLGTALRVLEMAGIATSPGYWRNQAANGNAGFLGQLLVNMANRSLDPLHRIVWAEARGEGLKGQTLVANVVLNRHGSRWFPDGVYNVIHQPGQFEPTRNGQYAAASPGPKNKGAVQRALGGEDHSRGALFFNSARLRHTSWAARNREHAFDHESHSFFF